MLDKNFMKVSQLIRKKILKEKENELQLLKEETTYNKLLKCVKLNDCEDIIKTINLKEEEKDLLSDLKRVSLKSEIEYLKSYIELIEKI